MRKTPDACIGKRLRNSRMTAAWPYPPRKELVFSVLYCGPWS